MDGLILRWMVMLLRYGGAGGENEAAPGDTNSRTHNTGGEIPASHGGPAKNTRNPMPGNLALCESKATPNINNRPARPYAKSVVGHSRRFWPRIDDFRSTPINRHRYRASACLKGAINSHHLGGQGHLLLALASEYLLTLGDASDPGNYNG